MTPEARTELQRIGAELDRHRQVRVMVGGIVLPEPKPTVEEEAKDDEQREQRQPRSRQQRESRERQQRRQRQSRERQQRPRRRSSGPAAHLGSGQLRTHYEAQVVELAKAYPTATVVATDEQGMWLRAESAVLDGSERSATFLVFVPFDADKFPKAWGFWNLPDGPRWIGPRHTNFPAGDVCAFVPQSGAWLPGGPLDTLIDFYSVWALRQLHLEEFGRWPGRQFSAHPYYALAEFKPDELCSCDKNEPPLCYGDCCRPDHLSMSILELKAGFEKKMGFPLNARMPPDFVVGYMQAKDDLAASADMLPHCAIIGG